MNQATVDREDVCDVGGAAVLNAAVQSTSAAGPAATKSDPLSPSGSPPSVSRARLPARRDPVEGHVPRGANSAVDAGPAPRRGVEVPVLNATKFRPHRRMRMTSSAPWLCAPMKTRSHLRRQARPSQLRRRGDARLTGRHPKCRLRCDQGSSVARRSGLPWRCASPRRTRAERRPRRRPGWADASGRSRRPLDDTLCQRCSTGRIANGFRDAEADDRVSDVAVVREPSVRAWLGFRSGSRTWSSTCCRGSQAPWSRTAADSIPSTSSHLTGSIWRRRSTSDDRRTQMRPMSRLMRDISPGTYVLNPDTPLR